MSIVDLIEADVAAYRARRLAEVRLQQAQQSSGRAVIVARGGGTSAKEAWGKAAPSKELQTAMVTARDAHLAAVERVTMAMEAT